jgi:hypothetical protein
MTKNNEPTINQNKSVQHQYSFSPSWVFFVIAGMVVLTILLASRVQVETNFSCNSDHVGLGMEANNYIQNHTVTKHHLDGAYDEDGNYTSEYLPYNKTVFDDTLLLKYIKLDDLDGLRCQGEANVKMPLILAVFMR